MAERETPPEYSETTEPQNPPNSMLSRETRRAALGSYLGPVVVLFIIVGIGLVYWSNRGPSAPDRDRDATHVGVGTTGENGPGAFDPTPRADNARDELEQRTGVSGPNGPAPTVRDQQAVTTLSALVKDASVVSGRHVDVNDVEVESIRGGSFWIRDDGERVEVIAPAGASLPGKGARVHVVGMIEGADGNRPRIRASSVTSR